MKQLKSTFIAAIVTTRRRHFGRIAIGAALALALACAVPRSAYGVLDVGQIVYDPSNFAKAANELEQDIKLVEQAMQTYKLLQSELRMISQRPWQTIATTLDS